MRSRLVWLFAFAVLLTAPLNVFAQRTTGDIRGVVTDESGAVLPGVTVTLRGPAVQGAPTTVTNESGVYRFPNLTPGVYEVTAELPGFSTKTQTGVQVSLGATQELPVQMAVSTQQETITVTAEAPVVDSASTQVATNYTREWVENIPVRRFTFFDLINASPGVSQSTQTSSRSQAFGSAANENLYLLDGTDFTAPLVGRRVAVAQHRRHRRSAGAVARRQRRIRQRRRRRVQHRHAPGLERVPRRLELLLPELEPDRPQHHRRAGRRPALQPRPLPRLHHPARRADPEGQAVVLRLLPVPGRLGIAARHAQGVPGQVERQALLLEVELQPQPEPPPAGADPRRLLRDPGARGGRHGAEHPRAQQRPQPLARRAVYGGHQPDHRVRGPLLGLLRHRQHAAAERRPEDRPPLPGPRHRQRHRRHLLLVRRQVVQDRVRRQDDEVRRQLPGRAARLQGGRAVQQRRRRVAERLQRLHLHLRQHPGLRLHAGSVLAWRPHARGGRVCG